MWQSGRWTDRTNMHVDIHCTLGSPTWKLNGWGYYWTGYVMSYLNETDIVNLNHPLTWPWPVAWIEPLGGPHCRCCRAADYVYLNQALTWPWPVAWIELPGGPFCRCCRAAVNTAVGMPQSGGIFLRSCHLFPPQISGKHSPRTVNQNLL